jgi:acyl-CoA thioester hydrolase
MPAKARCQLTVRHYECDPLGHVNHAVYLHYCEVGRLEAMAGAGLPFSKVLKQGYTVVATEVFVQYKAPAFTDDVLDVQSWITEFRGARMLWQQEVYRHSTGALLARAEVTGAFTLADGRPVRIPPAMQALLEAVHVPEAGQSASSRRRSSASEPRSQ